MRRTFPLAYEVSYWSRFKARFETRLFPWQATSQEKWLTDTCLLFDPSNIDRPLIVTAPRGYRKTFTAQRVASRYRWYYNIKYYYGDGGLKAFEQDERSRTKAHEARFLKLLSLLDVIFVTGLCFFVWSRFFDDNGTSQLIEHVSAALDVAASKLPSRSTVCAFLFMVWWFWSRRRIVIFDDLTRFPSSYLEAQYCLDKAKCLSRVDRKVVVLSSNEGLPLFFSDSTTMVALQLPHATEAEFYSTLRRSGWCPQKALRAAGASNDARDAHPTAFKQLTATELKSVQDRLLEHHAFSVRVFQRLCTVDFGLLIANVNVKFSRADLWAICRGIDLVCEATLAWATLGCCPAVEVSELERVFEKAAMERITTALGTQTKLPRRLLLLAGLLATANVSDEMEPLLSVADHLNRLTPPLSEEPLLLGYTNSRVVLDLMPFYMPQHHLGPLQVRNAATSEICWVTPKGYTIQHLQAAIAEVLKTNSPPVITDSISNTPLSPETRLRVGVVYAFHALGSSTMRSSPPSRSNALRRGNTMDASAQTQCTANSTGTFTAVTTTACKCRHDDSKRCAASAKECPLSREVLDLNFSRYGNAPLSFMFTRYFIWGGPGTPPLCVVCKKLIDDHQSRPPTA